MYLASLTRLPQAMRSRLQIHTVAACFKANSSHTSTGGKSAAKEFVDKVAEEIDTAEEKVKSAIDRSPNAHKIKNKVEATKIGQAIIDDDDKNPLERAMEDGIKSKD